MKLSVLKKDVLKNPETQTTTRITKLRPLGSFYSYTSSRTSQHPLNKVMYICNQIPYGYEKVYHDLASSIGGFNEETLVDILEDEMHMLLIFIKLEMLIFNTKSY